MTGIIQAHRTETGDIDAQPSKICRDAPGTPHAVFFLVTAKNGHWGFRADAFGIPVDVAIQDKIADQQHPLTAERFDELNQPRYQATGSRKIVSKTQPIVCCPLEDVNVFWRRQTLRDAHEVCRLGCSPNDC